MKKKQHQVKENRRQKPVPILFDGWGAHGNDCVFCGKSNIYCFPVHRDLKKASEICGVCENCAENNPAFLRLKDRYEKWVKKNGQECLKHKTKFAPHSYCGECFDEGCKGTPRIYSGNIMQ